MVSFAEVVKNFNWSYLTDILMSAVPALLCIMVHESCHGLAAWMLGDETAKKEGRLSLNPLHHIDILGLVMLAVFKFGWAKPVNVDARNFKNPKAGMALTAIAGPISNFLLAALVLFLRGFFTEMLFGLKAGETLLTFMDTTAYISVCLGMFNLIPVPPLDGSKVLFAFLPDRIYMKLMRYERYGMIIMLLLVVSGIISAPLGKASAAVFKGMFDFVARGAYRLRLG